MFLRRASGLARVGRVGLANHTAGPAVVRFVESLTRVESTVSHFGKDVGVGVVRDGALISGAVCACYSTLSFSISFICQTKKIEMDTLTLAVSFLVPSVCCTRSLSVAHSISLIIFSFGSLHLDFQNILLNVAHTLSLSHTHTLTHSLHPCFQVVAITQRRTFKNNLGKPGESSVPIRYVPIRMPVVRGVCVCLSLSLVHSLPPDPRSPHPRSPQASSSMVGPRPVARGLPVLSWFVLVLLSGKWVGAGSAHHDHTVPV